MDCVSLYKTMETPLSWRTDAAPCVILTAGLKNRVRIHLKDTPEAKDAPTLSGGVAEFQLYTIPKYYAVTPAVSAQVCPGSTGIDFAIELPANIDRGYYRAQITYWEDTRELPDAVYTCWVVVDKKVKPTPDNYMDINSIRMQFADVCSLDNRMLESLEVSAGDIASAVCRCLEQWDSIAPRIRSYAGHNFPYTELLRNGVLYHLIQALWTFLERNRMQYQAGGVAVDLERRADSFKALKSEYEGLWRTGIAQIKMEENLQSFSGGVYYE